MIRILIVLLLGSQVQFASANCLSVNNKKFQKEVLKLRSKKIIFFASWCPPCKKHLIENKGGKSIFVASFDSKSAADIALKGLGMDQEICFYDDGNSIAKAYNVNETPAIREVKPSS